MSMTPPSPFPAESFILGRGLVYSVYVVITFIKWTDMDT